MDSALVSFSRDPEAATGEVYREAGTGNSYRYTAPRVGGGIDVAMSLGTASYAYQQEIVHWKGMTAEHVARADTLDQHDELSGSLDNPYASAEATAAQAQLDQQTAQDRVENAAAGAELGQASEYDKFCHQYAEWHSRSGQHSEHGQIDGYIRTYAEWWANNYHQPEAQEFAAKWAETLGPQWSHREPPMPPPATQALYNQFAEDLAQAAQMYPQQQMMSYTQQQGYTHDPYEANAAQMYPQGQAAQMYPQGQAAQMYPQEAYGTQTPPQVQPQWDQSSVAYGAQMFAPQNPMNYPSAGTNVPQGTDRTFDNVQYSQRGPVQQSQYRQQYGPYGQQHGQHGQHGPQGGTSPRRRGQGSG